MSAHTNANAIARIGVVGAGAWGTALATVAHNAGRNVVLRARTASRAALIAESRRNDDYLPGIAIDPAIAVTADLADLAGCDAILLVVPAQTLRAVTTDLLPSLQPATVLVMCAKGIEQATGQLMTEVAGEVLATRANPRAVLSGPNLAGEIAAGLPAATTIACTDIGHADALAAALRTRTFRPYAATDVLGAQIGGAVKNVIAIACGVIDGLALGENARAGLLTRGLAEVSRLAAALGAEPATMTGLSGLGDMALTCASAASRNHRFGVALANGANTANGDSAAALLADARTVTEGVATSAAVTARAKQHAIDMPICAAVDAVLHDGADLKTTIHGLLDRPLRREA